MSRTFRVALGLAVLAFLALGILRWIVSDAGHENNGRRVPTILDQITGLTETIEHTDYHPPQPADPGMDVLLADDTLDTKQTTFDPGRVDRRPLDGWLVNASEAVIRLDMPMVKPDRNPELLTLHPSYAAATAAARAGATVLPSVNLVDGKAKQFDDGLYAALDQAYFVGQGATLPSLTGLTRRIHDKLPAGSEAADYLAAGLSLAAESDPSRKGLAVSDRAQGQVDRFLRLEVFAKPIGVYTWNPTLGHVFRVLRFFSRPILARPVVDQITGVLRDDPALLAEYRRALGFYAKLTNPLAHVSPADFLGETPPDPKIPVSFFPPSTSRETVLFERLFPRGVPPGTDLMRTLVEAVRSGQVDLTPRPDSGWYDWQVHALETLLLPGRGEESNKLLLTKSYKKRMLEAFQALITKRRETHVRQLAMALAPTSAAPRALEEVKPRLRVEPCPSYYLRTARSYAFLEGFLVATVGAPTLQALHGLRADGNREPDLLTELRAMRDLFYGLHLLSAEDIGMAPALRADEPVDRPACERAAETWLASRPNDPDLAADTRVAVPVYIDQEHRVTRLWVTLGVRLSPLQASYARGPRVRPEPQDDAANKDAAPPRPGREDPRRKGNPDDWTPVEPYKLAEADYLIPVDEFAEIEVPGLRVFTRDELRAICTQARTRAAILEALKRP